MRKIVKQLRHGQITIPKDLREAIGLEEDDLLSITLAGSRLEIEPMKLAHKARGSPWARELYRVFEPVRESLKDVPEDEINTAIEKALKESRRRGT